MLRALLVLLALALPVQAEEVVAGLSQNRISITTNFDGSEILIFGAVKRESPIPDDAPLEVIITVAGPSTPAASASGSMSKAPRLTARHPSTLSPPPRPGRT